jgi:hypothetical protein
MYFFCSLQDREINHSSSQEQKLKRITERKRNKEKENEKNEKEKRELKVNLFSFVSHSCEEVETSFHSIDQTQQT